MACGRGFNSPRFHHNVKSQPLSGWDFFCLFPQCGRGFRAWRSRAPPLGSRHFHPRRRLSVHRFLWRSRERSRGHLLSWCGFRGGRLWMATPVAVATERRAATKKPHGGGCRWRLVADWPHTCACRFASLNARIDYEDRWVPDRMNCCSVTVLPHWLPCSSCTSSKPKDS